MEKLRILFVDDEPDIVAGLRDALRKDRTRWEFQFVTSGSQALERIRSEAWDLIVTDMRMPGTDGIAVLQAAQSHCPQATRVVLSGHATLDALRKALPLAHQYLAKPCDLELIRGLIESVEWLKGLLPGGDLRQVVGRLAHLPPVPTTYLALTEAAQDPNKGAADIAAIVERDPAMSAKVLQMVNSSYFGLGRKLQTVQEATLHLGMEMLKGLAFVQSLSSSSKNTRAIERYQEQSLATATLARKLPRSREEQGFAFTLGVIHDIGGLVLAEEFPEQYQALLTQTGGEVLATSLERDTWGVTHAEIGAYLLGSWGLPRELVVATAFHHEPGQALSTLTAAPHQRALGAVVLADHALSPPSSESLDETYFIQVGLKDELPAWKVKIQEELARLQ